MNRVPDWRFRPDPTLRDIKPGLIPLNIEFEDKRVVTLDFPVEIIERLETLARNQRRSFVGLTGKLLALMIEKDHGEMFGF